MTEDSQIPQKFSRYSHLYHVISSHATNTDKGAGILLFVNKTEEIIEYHEYIPGRLIFLKVKNKASNQILNIFSLYGKSHVAASEIGSFITPLYDRIIDENLSNTMIVGDFNFVTAKIDRNSNNFTATDKMYLKHWEKLEVDLGLVDSFRITNPKRRLYTFSHTNGTSKSRIDRLYLSGDLQGKVLSTIFENVFCSDHKLVRLKLAQEVDKGPGQWVFNNVHLQDQDFVDQIKTIILDFNDNQDTFPDAKSRWECLKMNLADHAIKFSKEKARQNKRDVEKIRTKIEILEQTPMHHVDEAVNEAINNLRVEEDKFTKLQMEGSLLRSKMPHIEFNEKDISLYSRLEKINAENNTIYALIDDSDSLKQGTDDILKVVHDFYSNLYTNEPECELSQEYFLSKVNVCLTDEDRRLLDSDFTPDEFDKALSKLQNRKSPGSDGLTKEFYDFFWTDIRHHYMSCIEDCEASGEMTLSQKLGLIRVSYKKNGRVYIKNYRPITLINVDSKILTRTLATRMAKVLHKLIHRNQTCVPGRCICNNTHIIQDLIDVINMEGIGAALILLDQEKAFDRMSHSFIIKVLRKFGFGERFIKWVTILYTDIRSAVKVNGYLTDEFPIKRGVRQGCPLSALLYVLCAEVLAIEIRSNSKIIGYKFNKSKDQHKLTQFADDNAVVLTTEASILELFVSLEKYEHATNARINKDKTVGVWLGTFRGNSYTFAGIKWTDDPVESLGVFVGNDRALCSQTGFSAAKEKVKVKMSYWKSKNISTKGRIKVLNIFILSKLWYLLESQVIANNILTEFNSLISNFVWKDIHQVQFNCLHENYKEGGLNLQDICLKKQALRVKWLIHLTQCDDSCIEKHLSNILIGRHKKIVGLKILHASHKFDKDIQCEFYREAIKAWRIIFHSYVPKNMLDIKRDWIYENVLLKDDDGRIFKPPSHFPAYAPEYFYDLPVTDNPREFRGIYRNLIPKLNQSFMKLSFCDNDKSVYFIATPDGSKDVTLCNFSTIYISLLNLRKPSVKPWKTKWEQEGVITTSDWPSLWDNIHHYSLSQVVQSSLWEMVHRNFMCSYFAKLAFGQDGACKLCRTEEMERTHIFVSCPIINSVYVYFTPLLNNFCPGGLTLKEKTMGITVIDNDNKCILRNYITSTIKHIAFRNRNNFFSDASAAIINLTKNFIKKDLSYKWMVASNNNKKDSYRLLYLHNSILGLVDENGVLQLNF